MKKITLISFLFLFLCLSFVKADLIWQENNDLVIGLINFSTLKLRFCDDCTGTGMTELIVGTEVDGFYGYKFNGVEWINDQNMVDFYHNYLGHSAPIIYFNCTGTGYYEMIFGTSNNGIYSYKHNGTEWVMDVNIRNGLPTGHMGEAGYWRYQTPTICFNCTGTGYYEMIFGTSDNNESGFFAKPFYGFEFNGTKWVENSDIVNGLSSMLWTNPNLYFNLTGDNKYILILATHQNGFESYEFDGVTWIKTDDVVSGLSDSYTWNSLDICFNCLGTGKYELIAGSMLDGFFGYTLEEEPPYTPTGAVIYDFETENKLMGVITIFLIFGIIMFIYQKMFKGK